MSGDQIFHRAEQIEKHIRTLALISVLCGLIYWVSAAQKIELGFSAYFRTAEIILAVVVIGLALPMVAWKFSKLNADQRRRVFQAEGFVFEIITKSVVISWVCSLFFVLTLKFLTKNYFKEVPSEFFLEITVAFMATVCGITFFVLCRGDEQEVNAQDSPE